MLFPELAAEPAIYAYSFICTNIDCSTPAKAAAVEHWYRHRTSAATSFCDSKHGAALRHPRSGHEQVSTAWMWASLIAATIAAWLHQLTGLTHGGKLARPASASVPGIIWAATLPDDGPRGGFFRDGQPHPW